MEHPFDGTGLTFIFTTIAREACARRLIDSALAVCPKLKILIADQNSPSEEMEAFYRDRAVEAHWVPFDFGVSASRSLLAQKVTTPFLVYGDDDFVFTSRTRFGPVIDYLKARPDVALVTGGMIDQIAGGDGSLTRIPRRYESYMYRDFAHRGLILVPIDHVKPGVDVHNGEYFYECDIGLNWAMVRTSLFNDKKLLWDARFKTNGEHENFFLQLKQESVGDIMYYPRMECDHSPVSNSRYGQLRSRDDGWIDFGKKWELDWCLYVGKSFHEYRNYSGSAIRFVSVGQGIASHLPPRQGDYLRVWANGSSIASLSDKLVLKEAKEHTRAVWQNAEKRIQRLSSRLEKAAAENERLAKIIAEFRRRMKSDAGDPSSTGEPSDPRRLQQRAKALAAENRRLARLVAERDTRLESGSLGPSDSDALSPRDRSVVDQDLARTNAALREKNNELREKVSRQKAELERQRGILEDLRARSK